MNTMELNVLNTVRHVSAMFVLFGLAACGGGGGSGAPAPSPPPPSPLPSPNANCVITNQTTSSGGSVLYEYDGQAMPLKITRYAGGSVELATDVYYNAVISTGTSPSGYGVINAIRYDADLFYGVLPYMAQVSLTTDISPANVLGNTQVNYKQYFFFFDDKDRLITVGEQTSYVGDWEWDLHIYYNDKNNVTALQYEWTTGPNVIIPPIPVTAYDDNPTPYTANKIWKYLTVNWDGSDPEPILTALSSNNPLDYTLGNIKRTMTYKYNASGFPTERVNTNTSSENGSSSTFTQAFYYVCN